MVFSDATEEILFEKRIKSYKGLIGQDKLQCCVLIALKAQTSSL